LKLDGLTIVFLLALAAAVIRWVVPHGTSTPKEPPPNVADGQAAAGAKKEAAISKGRLALEKMRRVTSVIDRWRNLIKRSSGPGDDSSGG